MISGHISAQFIAQHPFGNFYVIVTINVMYIDFQGSNDQNCQRIH